MAVRPQSDPTTMTFYVFGEAGVLLERKVEVPGTRGQMQMLMGAHDNWRVIVKVAETKDEKRHIRRFIAFRMRT